jgi:hypothetical protein
MKKLLALLLVTAFCFTFCSCSKNDDVDTSDEVDEAIATEAGTTVEDETEASTTVDEEIDTTHEEIDGYQYAEFEKYNSYAKDNGLGDTLVYIKGEVKSVYDHENTCMLSVVSEDGGRWAVGFLAVGYSDEIKELLDEKSVVCFGDYRGFSDVFQMPAIVADKVEVDNKTYNVVDLLNLSVAPQDQLENQFVYNKVDDVEIIYESIHTRQGITALDFHIKNNSDKNYFIQSGDVSVNGYQTEAILFSLVNSKDEADTLLSFLNSNLEKNNINSISDIKTICIPITITNSDEPSEEISETIILSL